MHLSGVGDQQKARIRIVCWLLKLNINHNLPMHPPTHFAELDNNNANAESEWKSFNKFIRTLDQDWRKAVLSKVDQELGQKIFEIHTAAELAIAAEHLSHCTDPLHKRRIHAAFKTKIRQLGTLYGRRK